MFFSANFNTYMIKAAQKFFNATRAVMVLIIGVLAIAFDFWVAKN